MMGMHRPNSITLLRHGEYYWNIAQRANFHFESLDDVPHQIIGVQEQHVPLTPAGKEQAIATGHALAEMYPKGFITIFYSPWLRVRQTLELMQAAWQDDGIRARVKRQSKDSKALAEQDQGDNVLYLDPDKRESWDMQFKRLRLLELKHRDYTKFRHNGLTTGDIAMDLPTMTGESHWQVVRRVGGFLQRIYTPQYGEKDVVIIGHLASLMGLRAEIEHIDEQTLLADLNREDKKFAISNCGMCRYEWRTSQPASANSDYWERVFWNKTFYNGAILDT